jgi:hypothetical protein
MRDYRKRAQHLDADEFEFTRAPERALVGA